MLVHFQIAILVSFPKLVLVLILSYHYKFSFRCRLHSFPYQWLSTRPWFEIEAKSNLDIAYSCDATHVLYEFGIGSTNNNPLIYFIPFTCLLDDVFIKWGEILSLSLMGEKGLRLWEWKKQEKLVLVVKQILLVNSIGNVYRTVWRKYILKLRCKRLLWYNDLLKISALMETYMVFFHIQV